VGDEQSYSSKLPSSSKSSIRSRRRGVSLTLSRVVQQCVFFAAAHFCLNSVSQSGYFILSWLFIVHAFIYEQNSVNTPKVDFGVKESNGSSPSAPVSSCFVNKVELRSIRLLSRLRLTSLTAKGNVMNSLSPFFQ
jgi:hypothetical protein